MKRLSESRIRKCRKVGAMILGVSDELTSCTTSSSEEQTTTMNVRSDATKEPRMDLAPSSVKLRHCQCWRSSIERRKRANTTAKTNAHAGMIQKLERTNSRRR